MVIVVCLDSTDISLSHEDTNLAKRVVIFPLLVVPQSKLQTHRLGERHMAYQNILVPVDGSENSIIAIQHAINLAKAFHSKITIVQVLTIDSWRIQT